MDQFCRSYQPAARVRKRLWRTPSPFLFSITRKTAGAISLRSNVQSLTPASSLLSFHQKPRQFLQRFSPLAKAVQFCERFAYQSVRLAL